jgi:methylated-DNA-protein-cysteine methyltransferase-like protein
VNRLGLPADTYARIYAVIRRIPRGRVATYGQVAEVAGIPGHARQVGYALHALKTSSTVPWHRVVNARGMISLGAKSGGDPTQQLLLEREGICFDAVGRVDLKTAGWRPRDRMPGRRPRRC